MRTPLEPEHGRQTNQHALSPQPHAASYHSRVGDIQHRGSEAWGVSVNVSGGSERRLREMKAIGRLTA
jgi:hypothetical protein